MKKFILGLAILTSTTIFAAKYADGTYRGNFFDSGVNQVNLEFVLKNDKVESITYKILQYKDINFMTNTDYAELKDQYDALRTYAVGKDIDDVMKAFYNPGDIEKAGATIRATKIRSAIKDGLIHDVYTPAKK